MHGVRTRPAAGGTLGHVGVGRTATLFPTARAVIELFREGLAFAARLGPLAEAKGAAAIQERVQALRAQFGS